MYGRCEICGALHGTVDGRLWYEGCEHIKQQVHIMISKRKCSTCTTNDGQDCRNCKWNLEASKTPLVDNWRE